LLDGAFVGFDDHSVEIDLAEDDNLEDLIVFEDEFPPEELQLLVFVVHVLVLDEVGKLPSLEAAVGCLHLGDQKGLAFGGVPQGEEDLFLLLEEVVLEGDLVVEEVEFELKVSGIELTVSSK
jgi:hypothetical protein